MVMDAAICRYKVKGVYFMKIQQNKCSCTPYNQIFGWSLLLISLWMVVGKRLTSNLILLLSQDGNGNSILINHWMVVGKRLTFNLLLLLSQDGNGNSILINHWMVVGKR